MPEYKIYRADGKPLTKKQYELLERLIETHVIEVEKTATGLAIRAFVIGRLLANYAMQGLAAEDIIVEHLPTNLRALTATIGSLSEQDRYAIEFAKQHAAEHIVDLNNSVRSAIRKTIVNGMLAQKGPDAVASDLYNAFKNLNKDWRRIAITEANIAAGQGYMRSMIEHGKRRNKTIQLLGQSAVDACKWCKENIQGKVFTLIDTDEAPTDPNDKKWDTHIWPGKSNIGRAFSKNKYVVGPTGKRTLIERPNSELAKACFGEHPYGRCWFVRFFPRMQLDENGYIKL